MIATLLISIVVIAVYAAGLVFAHHAAERAHTAQGGVAWAIALVTMPWVALPVYAVLGPPKNYALSDDQATVRERAFAPLLAALSADMRPAPERIGPREAPLERLAPAPITLSARPHLLVDGPQIFEAIFAAIAAARRSVCVGFYIIRDDATGRRLADALIAKAREGVHVRLLFDNVGSRNTSRRYWQRLEAAGVEVRAFDVARALPRLLRMNFRNHRKVVATDGSTAIVGGPNIADEYLGPSKWFRGWRDTAVQLTGPAAAVAEASFVEDWLWTGGEPPPATAMRPLLPHGDAQTEILLLPTGPADTLPTCSLALLHLITEARWRLWLASPYFVPDLDVLNALKLAAVRGVDVRILVPARPDHTVVWLASFAYAEEVLHAGVKLHRFLDGFMHQKVILVDDWVCGIGTVNFDNRSLRLNFENTALVFDRPFVEEVAAMLRRDFSRSRLYDENAHARRSRSTRLLAPVARLLGPLL